MALLTGLLAALRARISLPAIDDERGDVVQILAWSAVSIIVLVALGAVIQQFGVDLMAWAGKQLGIS